MTKPYGYELILDLHGCHVGTFNRESIDTYLHKLCEAINMEKCERYFWDDVGLPPEKQQISPKTRGTSAVQFILTSTIVVHTLELKGAVYVNIFACKAFDPVVAERLTTEWFGAKTVVKHFITRT